MFIRFLIMLLLVLPAPSNDEVIIEWSDVNKLSWSDFLGVAQNETNAAALTASGITFSFSVNKLDNYITNFDVKVKAHFYPEKSWYHKEKSTDYILAHEQLHFDITELHTRKLRYHVSKLKVSQTIKEELRQLHQQINIDLAEMQSAYDTESENSINKEQQEFWNAFITAELNKLSAYRNY